MRHAFQRALTLSLSLLLLFSSLLLPVQADTLDPSEPSETIKLVFMHHSCGSNWLSDSNGGLGIALRDDNYFVSDTNYGWVGGGVSIGDQTDIGHWWTWFLGPDRDAIMADLYAKSSKSSTYSRLATDPGGENQIIMFKSCYPNSNLKGNASDPPTTGTNPLEGQSCYSSDHTVGNAKAIYRDLLAYFETQPDKLFIVITAPPVQSGTYAANARAFNNWLVEDWLDGYPLKNVRVWDFYNVLTSNGGTWNINDLGAETGNHHRYHNNVIQHLNSDGGNTAAYPNGGSDNHPSPAGNQKATAEYVPLLNIWVNQWLAEQNQTYLPLTIDWNLVSLSTMPDNGNLPDVLASIDGSYTQITTYDAFDEDEPWSHYAPGLPEYAETLDTVDETMGLWIKCTEPVTLSVGGALATGDITIPVTTGWNLVGYPSQVTRTVPVALTSLSGSYDSVCAYQAGGWITYTVGAPPASNTLTEMEPGWGYWVRATARGDWHVPGD